MATTLPTAASMEDQVVDYLFGSVDAAAPGIPDVVSIIEAELLAQSRVVTYPDGEIPADLVEALCRRVARNRAVRSLPLGFQASMTEAAVAVTRLGQDPEVRRLEAPFRKLVIG